MKYKRVLASLLIFFCSFQLVGCSKKNGESKNAELNLYIDVKDKGAVDAIKLLIENYEKDNKNIKINTNSALNSTGSIVSDISKGSNVDIIMTSRNNMIELARKGMLRDIYATYDKNKITDRYCSILSSYGMFQDKHYGIGLTPNVLELLYNKEALKRINLAEPTNLIEVAAIMKKINATGIRIPVILNDDIDIYNGIISIIANNRIDTRKLEEIYDSGMEAYKGLDEMQRVFDEAYKLYSNGTINKNTFEIGNENTIDRLKKGDVPMVITTSYYNKNIDSTNSAETINLGVLNDYSLNTAVKGNIPVIINCIICIPTKSKNEESINEFIKYIYSDEAQKKLSSSDFLTGNKKIDKSLIGMNGYANKQLDSSNENSIVFVHSVPKNFTPLIASKINAILNGNHNGNEWKNIINEIYNK